MISPNMAELVLRHTIGECRVCHEGHSLIDGLCLDHRRQLALPKPKPLQTLLCNCCESYTKGRQWFNRDTGFGLCLKCWNWINNPTRTTFYMVNMYGYKGYHCAID